MLRKPEGRQCKEAFKPFLHLAPIQLQIVQGCPFQMWTDTVAVQGSWKLVGEGREEEALLAELSLKMRVGLGAFCKVSLLQRECFLRHLWLWIASDQSSLPVAAAASQSHSSSIVELQTCRTAHAKAAHSQVIFRSVHFPSELAAAPAVCMLRWLSKEGIGRALIQLRRFRGAKAGRKITNFDICCSLQVSLIIAWQDVKVHRHDPDL